MVRNIVEKISKEVSAGISEGVLQKSHYFFEQWKYLLFQEKCRLCERMIHPLIEGMNFEFYAPPAKYFLVENEIMSDVLCQFCLPHLTSCQAFLNQHQYKIDDDNINETPDFFVASGAIFREPIQSLIHRLKYSNDVLLAKDLTFLMLRAWPLLRDKIGVAENIESLCLVPVPLHKRRLNDRGYNQSQIVAQHLHELLKIKVESKSLYRIKNTQSQQELSKPERAKNVAEAFQSVNTGAFIGKKVILIDDVCTSGATLAECAKAVMRGGASAVFALTIAFVP